MNNKYTNLTSGSEQNSIDMHRKYYGCVNLTGSPVCDSKVVNMSWAYYNCFNITGSPVCGPNVTNMYKTYYNCDYLDGNMHMYSDNVVNMTSCFSWRNKSKKLHIYAIKNTITAKTLLEDKITEYKDEFKLISDNDEEILYYHRKANIYIHLVEKF